MSTELIIEYSKSTQNVCLFLGITIVLILLFMLLPLPTPMKYISKTVIIGLLAFIAYFNWKQTNNFANNFKINILHENEDWNTMKTNILCGYIFSLLLVILMLSIFRSY